VRIRFPYKKIYYNWATGKAESAFSAYPRIEAGQRRCARNLCRRIRYLGVLLYDADRIEQAASVADEIDLYQAQLRVFLDPNAQEVYSAGSQGRSAGGMAGGGQGIAGLQNGDDWKVALPLHPEYRTLRWCGTCRGYRRSPRR